MAVVDQADHAIVLSIVYDGPPEAGKTTSVRALARSFGREVYTPEEREGRTVYFDWLEHTGGRFDGAPIRCQIVSVPGQERWVHRRAHLLERADVVVFVGDTSAPAWPKTAAHLRDLRERLDAREGPAVGVVFQANRRDAIDAVGMSQVREQSGSARVALVESVALDGTGVREAFVFAVRLALDRVREEQRLGTLSQVRLDGAGEKLLEQLRALEPSASSEAAAVAAVAPGVAERPPSNVVALRPQRDFLRAQRVPSHEVPSGLVWPPVEGRILLREAMVARVESRLDSSGDHHASLLSGYRAHSAAAAVFDQLEPGRAALIAWARLHVSAQPLLSKGRCIVVAATDDDRFRLWQIVRAEPSLRELFVDGCESMIPRHAARQLASASRLLAEAERLCRLHALPLRCTLDTIGVSDSGQAIYVGDVPFAAPDREVAHGPQQIAEELAALLQQRTAAERAELCRELRQCQRRDFLPEQGAQVGELLSQLLLQNHLEHAR